VASTKAFTSQLVALVLFAIHLGQVRETLPQADALALIRELDRLPVALEQVLDLDGDIHDLARRVHKHEGFLYLGRGINYPIALEGALKLKEISYIHAEGYPAGEMKHGPIALIDDDLPVVALAPGDRVFDKMVSNIQEAKARGGRVIVVTNSNHAEALAPIIDRSHDAVIAVPDADPRLLPILLVVPLQLLAYHIAVERGCDVDQPRNLAKSVTVE
jgi:glucosamine--fructose-6-phosphate aminotransferase (isomerizing)